jgi:hypothetical protein
VQKPVLRIDGGRFALADAEERCVEAGDVVEETAPARHRPARNPWLGVVEIHDVPSVVGHLGDQVIAAQHRVPQQIGGVDAARNSAGHSHDRNGHDRGDRRSDGC